MVARRVVTVPTERVQVDALGGEVLVRGLTLSQRVAIAAAADGGAPGMLSILAATVLADDGEPLWPAEDWDLWAGQHLDDAVRLVTVARRLSGIDLEAARQD